MFYPLLLRYTKSETLTTKYKNMKTITKLATLLAVPFIMATTVNAQNLLDATMGADKASFEVESTREADNSGAAAWKDTKKEGYCFRSTDNAYDGKASMKFFADKDAALASGIMLASTKQITLEEGHTYRFSYWIFIDKEGSDKLSKISVARSKGWKELSSQKTARVPKGEWVKVESDEIVYDSETVTTGITIKLFAGNSNKKKSGISCYIDQVEVVDITAGK